MKEIPILMKSDLVLSTIEGIKRETRRLRGLTEINENPDAWEFVRLFDGHAKFWQKNNALAEKYIKCPYGQPGDILWVRETWGWVDGHLGSGWYVHKSVAEDQIVKWRPSIHMPKEACQLWLEVADIAVERIQDITESGAIAEGIERYIYSGRCSYYAYKDYLNRVPKSENDILNALGSYRSLWQKINGIESWDNNPWVWVVKYLRNDGKVIDTTNE